MKLMIAMIVFMPMLAFAGKEERDYRKNELDPKIVSAVGAFKGACGCDLKVTIDESIKSKDDMYTAGHVFEKIKDESSGLCSDAEAKKAICKMKTLEVKKGSTSGFKLEGSKGISTTDGQSYITFEMMSKVLDQ
jgi:hypothetical protein